MLIGKIHQFSLKAKQDKQEQQIVQHIENIRLMAMVRRLSGNRNLLRKSYFGHIFAHFRLIEQLFASKDQKI